MVTEETVPVTLSHSDLESIVIGIDMGLTRTGVAFSTTTHASPITLQVIQRWDGSTEVQNKIPTAVCYSAGNKGMKSWGFSCPTIEDLEIGMGVKDRFKLYLDPSVLDETFRHEPSSRIGSPEDVEMWFIDFLSALHAYIVTYIMDILNLAERSFTAVHYVFSVPAIWDGTTVAKAFEQVVKKAGFEAQDHFIEVALTEAEAAAIYTTQNSRHQRHVSSGGDDHSVESRSDSEGPNIETGNVLLVCDSGGGTTDVSIVQVESLTNIGEESGPIPKLKQLDFVDGPRAASIAVGSVQIDEAFLQKVEQRLALIPRINGVPHIPRYAAKKMLDRFEMIKTGFGTGESRALRQFTFVVPGLPEDVNDDRPEVRIRKGRMIFTRDEIVAMFDSQIDRIFEGIDHYLQQLEYRMPPEHVTYFVLSGGLGSSQYVQDKIWKRYGPSGHNGPQGYGMQILVSVDPELAVCKGLVIDKVYRLKYADSILTTRRCRESYGILFNELYSRQRHAPHGIRPSKNPIDDKRYALHQIRWLIRQGETIMRDRPVCKRFSRLIPVSDISEISLMQSHAHPDTRTTWRDIIAMSRTPQLHRLPTHIQEGDAQAVAEIVSSVNSGRITLLSEQPAAAQVERITKRTGLFIKSREYYKIEVEVRVYIRLADLRFEIWFANEQIAEPELVRVAWMYRPPNARQPSQTLRQLSLSNDNANRNSEDADPDWPLGLISE